MQSLGTLGAKTLGTVFAVAAGLPLGKYGPMIHIGSIVAAFLSRGARGIKQVDRLFESFRVFSTHAEKRDLVVSGAAAVGRYACMHGGCHVNSVIGFSRINCTMPPKHIHTGRDSGLRRAHRGAHAGVGGGLELLVAQALVARFLLRHDHPPLHLPRGRLPPPPPLQGHQPVLPRVLRRLLLHRHPRRQPRPPRLCRHGPRGRDPRRRIQRRAPGRSVGQSVT